MKRKQSVPGVKDAVLPAWTTDGTRLAWVQKSGAQEIRADVGGGSSQGLRAEGSGANG